MDRRGWTVMVLWLGTVAVGGTAGGLVFSHGNGVAAVVIGVLFVVGIAAVVWVLTYRWAQGDRERWRARSSGSWRRE